MWEEALALTPNDAILLELKVRLSHGEYPVAMLLLARGGAVTCLGLPRVWWWQAQGHLQLEEWVDAVEVRHQRHSLQGGRAAAHGGCGLVVVAGGQEGERAGTRVARRQGTPQAPARRAGRQYRSVAEVDGRVAAQ